MRADGESWRSASRQNGSRRHNRARRYERINVRELFRVIDWMMVLPPALEKVFWQEVNTIQQEKLMPFITTPQRVGRREGMREGIESLLRVRFGEAGAKLMPEIFQAYMLCSSNSCSHGVPLAVPGVPVATEAVLPPLEAQVASPDPPLAEMP